MKIYDTRYKQKVDFIPIKSKQVRIYVCGPTVYDDAHLGHARSSIVFDLLRRTFMALGYKVLFVKNFTDIDDKIINKANANNCTPEAIAQRYTQSYLNDMEALGVLPPDSMPKATENLDQIIMLIKKLLANNIAYQLENGDIYLNVPKDTHYGSISSRGIDDENQARITNDEHKKDLRDFALWKSYKGTNDVGYESPFGRGRPGWHIECSAMIEEVLAYQDEPYAIDIHGGGVDLLFPHHENEASQTRCATGHELAKYWMHNGFVNINGEKMSKSLGNSFFIKDALKVYSGEVLRNYLLGVHYRAILHFNEEDLLTAKKRLDKIYRLKKRIASGFPNGIIEAHEYLKKQVESKDMVDTAFCEAILGAMCDDLNISKALSIVEEMLNAANIALDASPKDKMLKVKLLANLDFLSRLLGIGGSDEVSYFQQGVDTAQKEHIETILKERTRAKQNKDYARADSLRVELEKMGILLSDTPNGTIWEKVE